MQALRKRGAQCPTGKTGDAWNGANAALHPTSDEAACVVGSEFLADGGITTRFQGS
ncbi:hypothetical protein NON00_11420 [Roseomonas sp. GC11]|uniref:hypothetical protein n=1 Tax=Roseomonas sp. GC11 TaxID=2950546 RepID=UPI00210E3440|nr:hypothetical protein [Roseomonas sp. GC11]MCQ4160536.1 hypothetical protein [Roseomonas sp. GC11]